MASVFSKPSKQRGDPQLARLQRQQLAAEKERQSELREEEGSLRSLAARARRGRRDLLAVQDGKRQTLG